MPLNRTFPGWRTMTGAQRRNAKMAAMFETARQQGHTTLGVNPPTWEGADGVVKGYRDRMGGIRIIHRDGTDVYLQPGDDTNDLANTLDSCGDDFDNIAALLCDFLGP